MRSNRWHIAQSTYRFIEDEIRPFLAQGGNLHTKGSRGYPTRLRQMLSRLDADVPITHATAASLRLPVRDRQIEHVVPVKRIAIEIVDPSKADPRSNTSFDAIAGGPATSPEHLLKIVDQLWIKCWVTPEEHSRLNKCMPSAQWDAPNGDGWLRYRLANIVAEPLTQPACADGYPARSFIAGQDPSE